MHAIRRLLDPTTLDLQSPYHEPTVHCREWHPSCKTTDMTPVLEDAKIALQRLFEASELEADALIRMPHEAEGWLDQLARTVEARERYDAASREYLQRFCGSAPERKAFHLTDAATDYEN